MAGEVKRVWVLGAGFSKSLGGPLLREVFSMHKRSEVLGLWPKMHHLHTDEVARMPARPHFCS